MSLLYDILQGIKNALDNSTGAVNTVSYEHHEIHGGSHYNYCDYAINQAAAWSKTFTFETPDSTKWTHFTFGVTASEGATLEVYEGATGVSAGTAVIPRNNNRNSTNTSTVTLLADPTIVDDGTRAAGFLAGGGREAGFLARDKENILKQNTIYVARIISLANSNDISWCAEWYEHTNR